MLRAHPTPCPRTPRAIAHLAALAVAAVAAAAAACSRDAPPLGTAPGPALTPIVADALKAIAPACELRRTADGEVRTCRGRQAAMTLELDRARHLRRLDATVLASQGAWEAWTLYEPLLPAVLPARAIDAARKRLQGEPADEVVDGVRVEGSVSGERYRLVLTWGAAKP